MRKFNKQIYDNMYAFKTNKSMSKTEIECRECREYEHDRVSLVVRFTDHYASPRVVGILANRQNVLEKNIYICSCGSR